MKRKTFLQSTAAVIGSSLFPSASNAIEAKKKSIRFAHLTDIHAKEGLIPETGMAKALHNAQLQKVDFIINGGDAINDALAADKQKTKEQWNIFHSILKKENSLPVYHTIGNHDVWGWFMKENLPTGQAGKPDNDRLYGKVWATETLEMKNRYYSFKKINWNIIVLDSTQLNPEGGYIGKIDEVQMAWLKEELSRIPATEFVCIVSHIPILSICAGLFFNKNQPNGDLLIQRNLMHTDFLALKKLFINYPQIKVCISGHIHLQDELNYLGIQYFCNGAVSGNWWNGSFQEFAPSYAIMELFDDGTVKRTMIPYEQR